MDIGTEKTLLDRVLGIVMMSGDAPGNPKHPFAMTLVKLLKKASVAHLGARDERLIAQEFGSIGSEIPAASVWPESFMVFSPDRSNHFGPKDLTVRSKQR